MNPLVSVIIPVFNSGKYLRSTISSVEKQTYKNIEVILIDNNSTELNTLNTLNQLGKKYKVLKCEKAGVSEARNLGIENCKGEYILPLDSDDIILPTFIAKCVKAFTLNSYIKVVRTNIELFGKKSGKISFVPFDFSILLARNLMVVSSMFKKADWNKIGGFDNRFVKGFEDWEFWINILKDGGKVHTIPEHLFKYRIRKNSRNHSLSNEDLNEARLLIWSKHKSLYAKHYLAPKETFEYKLIEDSKAFKLGSLILKPFQRLKLMP